MRYFFECTHTYYSGVNTGIQRVVRNVLRTLASNADRQSSPAEFRSMIFCEGKFQLIASKISYPGRVKADTSISANTKSIVTALLRVQFQSFRSLLALIFPGERFFDLIYAPRSRWGLLKLLLLPPSLISKLKKGVPHAEADMPIFSEGDILVLLDASFDLAYWPAIEKAKSDGAKIVFVIYDLIPERAPQFCQPAVVAAFRFWLKKALIHADGIVTISDSVSLDVAARRDQGQEHGNPGLRIKSFRLGCELDGIHASQNISDSVLRAILNASTPAYAYVSTIEPRKNHVYALSAFEFLWDRGVDANFIIVGRIGWKCDQFLQRLANHKELGKHLFIFHDIDDSDLSHLYKHAQGLILTSFDEGFGLPIVEALSHGLPAFVSDIPVFREINADGVSYVSLSSPEFLAIALQRHIDEGAHRMPVPAAWLSWDESSAELLDAVNYTVGMEKLTGSGSGRSRDAAMEVQPA